MSRSPLFFTDLPDTSQQQIYEIGKSARDRQIETRWQKMQEMKRSAPLTEAEDIAGIGEEITQPEADEAGVFDEKTIQPEANAGEKLLDAANETADIGKTSDAKEDLPVEESAENGIIKHEELYRKAPDSRKGFKFISQERFDSLTIEAKKNGATIVRGTPEVEKHLIDMNASASHLGGALLFMKDVCISDVLEETYHYMQNMRGLNDDKESILRTILNEIDAKQYLLDNAKKYQIPRNELELTQKQLEGYKKQLEEYRRK